MAGCFSGLKREFSRLSCRSSKITSSSEEVHELSRQGVESPSTSRTGDIVRPSGRTPSYGTAEAVGSTHGIHLSPSTTSPPSALHAPVALASSASPLVSAAEAGPLQDTITIQPVSAHTENSVHISSSLDYTINAVAPPPTGATTQVDCAEPEGHISSSDAAQDSYGDWQDARAGETPSENLHRPQAPHTAGPDPEAFSDSPPLITSPELDGTMRQTVWSVLKGSLKFAKDNCDQVPGLPLALSGIIAVMEMWDVSASLTSWLVDAHGSAIPSTQDADDAQSKFKEIANKITAILDIISRYSNKRPQFMVHRLKGISKSVGHSLRF